MCNATNKGYQAQAELFLWAVFWCLALRPLSQSAVRHFMFACDAAFYLKKKNKWVIPIIALVLKF